MQGTRSTKSTLRTAAAIGAAGMIALTGGAASAQAATKTLTYSCVYPYVNAQPLKVVIDHNIPSTYTPGQALDAFNIKVVATANAATYGAVDIIGSTSIEGVATAVSTITAPGQTVPPLNVPIYLPNQPTVQQPDGTLILNAAGTTPKITLKNAGTATVSVDSISLLLKAKLSDGTFAQDLDPVNADGDPDTFAVSCSYSPANQDKILQTLTSGGGTTPTPTPTPTPTTPTPTPTPTTPTPTPTTPTPTPTPTTYNCATVSGETQIDYPYTLGGSATLKTLVKGALPLTGTINAKLGVPSGCFSADLTLGKTQGNLTALGFLPVTAKVALEPTAKTTGQLYKGVLKANAKVRIKLSSVTLFGLPLAGGDQCQAKQISSIDLQSTQAAFLPLSGGPIAGTFTISDLSGCGPLTGIVSPLTAGKGNAILLNLTPVKK